MAGHRLPGGHHRHHAPECLAGAQLRAAPHLHRRHEPLPGRLRAQRQQPQRESADLLPRPPGGRRRHPAAVGHVHPVPSLSARGTGQRHGHLRHRRGAGPCPGSGPGRGAGGQLQLALCVLRGRTHQHRGHPAGQPLHAGAGGRRPARRARLAGLSAPAPVSGRPADRPVQWPAGGLDFEPCSLPAGPGRDGGGGLHRPRVARFPTHGGPAHPRQRPLRRRRQRGLHPRRGPLRLHLSGAALRADHPAPHAHAVGPPADAGGLGPGRGLPHCRTSQRPSGPPTGPSSPDSSALDYPHTGWDRWT